MRFLTRDETRQWCEFNRIELVDASKPKSIHDSANCLRMSLVNDVRRIFWFANFIERTLMPRDRCLLWVTQAGVWPSSENWHLYYRVRQSYGDHRLLEEAPGHLFLEYEAADLVTFVELGLFAGWDMYLLTCNGYGRAFICHDEWIEFGMDDPKGLDAIKAELTKVGCRVMDLAGGSQV